MAKVYLEDTDTNFIVGNNNTEVYGTGGRSDSILINADTQGVVVSSTIESIELDGDLSQFQFSQGFGSNINILDAAGNVIVSMGSVDGKNISVDDKILDIEYADGGVIIGGNELSSTPLVIESVVDSGYTIDTAGFTTASDDVNEVFTIINGSYTHTISNLDISKDKLNFGVGITADDISVINTENDGRATLSYTSDGGVTVTEIELTGLTTAEDISLTTADGLNNILFSLDDKPVDKTIDKTIDKTDDVAVDKSNDDIDTDDYVNGNSIGDAGDSRAVATSISFDNYYNDVFIYGYAANEDNYTFVASNDGSLTLDLYGMDDDLDLELYNSNGVLLTSSMEAGSSNDFVNYEVSAGESYTVTVDPLYAESGYSLYAWMDYTAEIDNENDDYVWNDSTYTYESIGDAGDFAWEGTTLSLSSDWNDLFVSGYASDDDDYTFVATTSGTMYIDLYNMNGDLDLALYNSNGDSVEDSVNFGSNDESIEYEVTAGEQYTVGVEVYDESSYDLSVSIYEEYDWSDDWDSDQTDVVDGDDWTDPVLEDNEFVVTGKIISEGYELSSIDNWKFTHNGGSLIIDTLTETNNNYIDINGDGVTDHVDIMIRLYDSVGNLVALNDDSSYGTEDGSTNNGTQYHIQDSYINIDNLDAGVYSLAIGSFDLSDSEVMLDQNDNSGEINDPEEKIGDYQIKFSGNITAPELVDAPSENNNLAITNIIDSYGDYSNVTMCGVGNIVGDKIDLYDEDNNLVVSTLVNSDNTWNIDISNLENTPVNDNEYFHVVDSIGESETVHYNHEDWSSSYTWDTDDFIFEGIGNDNISIEGDDVNNMLKYDGGQGEDTITFHGDYEDFSIYSQSEYCDTIGAYQEEIIISDITGTTNDVITVLNTENFTFDNGTYSSADLFYA